MAINWKIIAWIFIIIFILETCLIVWAYNKGTSMEDNKSKCSNEICFNVDADAFIYDDYSSTCECYRNNEIIKREILK